MINTNFIFQLVVRSALLLEVDFKTTHPPLTLSLFSLSLSLSISEYSIQEFVIKYL